MEIEPLFKARRKLNGLWVYGSLLKNNESEDWDFIVSDFDYDDSFDPIRVITKTIGQYTGLKDKNGTKIFEGDNCLGYKKNGKKITGNVLYKKTEFIISTKDFDPLRKMQVRFGDLLDIEVIGNIHDNPELLK